MQDKEWTDAQFTDQAWSEMRKILDREMPVSTNRYRLLWILLLLLALALSAGLGRWWSDDASQKAIPPVALTTPSTKEKPPAEQPSGASQPAPATDQIAPSSDVKKQNAGSRPPGREAAAAFADPSVVKKRLHRPEMEADQHHAAAGSAKENISTPKNLDNVQPAGPDPEPSAPENSSDNLEPKPDPRSLSPIDWLPMNIITPLEEPERGNFSLTAIEKPNFWDASLRWGLLASGQVVAQKGLNGVALGLTVDLDLNARWLIHTGLQFRSVDNGANRLYTVVANDRANAEKDSSFTDPATVGGMNLDQKLITRQIDEEGQFQYLDLPIRIGYRLHPRFGLHTGMEISYLLKKSDILLEQFPPGSSFNQPGNAIGDLYQLRKWDMSGNLGFSYHISRNLAMSLDYQHHLFRNAEDLLKQGTEVLPKQLSTLDHSFRLSLVYYMK